ncbi:D123-domain-containing protein [Lasiosphaeria miniovina]|uniref:D123-domain-containing protein n=1 Tax=Lasiosphaeria miniovina TaxID=1954250 RepID=A0AA40AVY7_9PEZI|nr:D123-domain-containing protein [Lasiosphaeria miniovina]KAK0722997.1 D123-domain-containing protein [Lasiosphaeria miniovina]
MPAFEASMSQRSSSAPDDGELHFPPVTRDHILHCSYDNWFPKYRTSCIRSRIIPLTAGFVSYLREDGIILADEGDDTTTSASAADQDWEPTFTSAAAHRPPSRSGGGYGQQEEDSSDSDSDSESDAGPPPLPPNRRFPALHTAITAAIAELGGAVAPKLNWSSPKDATWISRHPNTVKCTSANDVYVLLKSSSFVSHDLDHAFDDTVPPPSQSTQNFSPVLVLRAFFSPLPSLEFRCFVKDRNLVAITQRDLAYYGFLRSLRGAIVARVRELFRAQLRLTFPDACFVFDVYIPEAATYDSSSSSSDDDDDPDTDADRAKPGRLGRARLIDINPWAPRTDTLLFGWGELLGVRVARPVLGGAVSAQDAHAAAVDDADTDDDDAGGLTTTDDEEEEHEPELRLVEQDDPTAYNFSSAPYSAHKLPKDVVDASMAGEGGMREFAQRWQRLTENGAGGGRWRG